MGPRVRARSLGPDGNAPRRDEEKTPLVIGTNAASPPHRNIRTTRWLRLGAAPNISRFSVAVMSWGRPMMGPASIAGCNRLQRFDVRARRESEGLSRHGRSRTKNAERPDAQAADRGR